MRMLFENIKESDKVNAIEELIHESSPRASFFFLVILSILMATLGIISNNASVVIGSMLIAPMLSPILSLSLAFTMSDTKLIKWSFFTLVKATVVALVCSVIVALIFGHGMNIHINPEIQSRIEPSIGYLMIAVIAGLATSFARVKPDLNDALPGTAIAVALVPPIAVCGIGLAKFDPIVASGAFQLYILNLLGIIVSSIIMFSMMNLYPKRIQAANAQEKEARAIEREKIKIEKDKAREASEKKKVQDKISKIKKSKKRWPL